jgi:hypothetical protein
MSAKEQRDAFVALTEELGIMGMKYAEERILKILGRPDVPEHPRRKCIKCGLMIQYGFVPHLGANGEICDGPCSPPPARTDGLREAQEQLLGALYMVKLLKASVHALRSYEYGNSDPTMAKTMADQIDAALAPRGNGGTPLKRYGIALNGTAFMGMMLDHGDHIGPEFYEGNSFIVRWIPIVEVTEEKEE